MKKLLSVALSLFVTALVIAQPPKGPAKKGMTFGNKVERKGAVTADELEKTVTDEKESQVKVQGKVTDVCTMEGCWLKMETSSGKIMVKMKDHSFLVPVDINGKTIVVDGTAKLKLTPVSELQHYAEDAGKSKQEIAKITEPKKEITINANGILVL